MKSLTTSLLLIVGSTIIFSCGEKKQDATLPVTQDTPAALQESKFEIKSYGRSSGDLTEELYAGLIEKDPALKKLEEELDAYNIKPALLKETFENYNSKSIDYYASANRKAEMIGDSVLKQKITAFITHSHERYLKKTSKSNALLKQISETNLSISDHHIALKVLITMPLIEKYQSDNAVNEKAFKDLIKEQEGLLKQTGNLTPEF